MAGRQALDRIIRGPLIDDWHAEAGCYGTRTPDNWFQETHDTENLSRRALFVCMNRCPVRLECLTHALEHRERVGIWGGLRPNPRRILMGQVNRGELTVPEAIAAGMDLADEAAAKIGLMRRREP